MNLDRLIEFCSLELLQFRDRLLDGKRSRIAELPIHILEVVAELFYRGEVEPRAFSWFFLWEALQLPPKQHPPRPAGAVVGSMLLQLALLQVLEQTWESGAAATVAGGLL